MNEHGCIAVPAVDERDDAFGIFQARRRKTLHRFDNVVKGQLEMPVPVNARKLPVRRLGSEQAHHLSDLVIVDEALHGGQADKQ